MAVPTLSLASFYRRTGTLRPRHEGRETRTGHRGNKVKRKAPKVCLFPDMFVCDMSLSPNNQHNVDIHVLIILDTHIDREIMITSVSSRAILCSDWFSNDNKYCTSSCTGSHQIKEDCYLV